MKFSITIPPKAQIRERVRACKIGDRFVGRSHKHPKQRLEENRLVALLMEHKPPEPLDGPILLGLKAFMPIPKSKSKKWKEAALAGEIRPTVKPDFDNILKNFKDVCSGIFWTDDRQVVGYLDGTGKYYGDPPRYEIEIKPLEGHGETKT
ncbi:MAG: RusA family crossover junction endodeoxyribonuclease [Deltaproteobacteria bacterium]|nr:RusA family crossover junction endodeoxyribonuclease [Deltaproteobacteria bacterium]